MTTQSENVQPYGSWPSPISAAMVASAGVDIGHLEVDDGRVYWREERPLEDGRGVIVAHDGERTWDVTPDSMNVRTLVHEYGGGDFAVADGVVYFANFEDQRVYRQPTDGTPEPITPAPATDRGLRYADFCINPDGADLYCVREDHDAMAAADGPDEPVAAVVRLSATGENDPTVVSQGHDFYAAPRLSPTGDRLAWLSWDHPNMPWDGTELHVGRVNAAGTIANEEIVFGGQNVSVFQPAWRNDGTLHAVSDRSGWWNLYRWVDGEWVVYRDEAAEYGIPQWLFGFATYAFLDDGRVAVVVTRDGQQSLELIDPTGTVESPDLPYDIFGGSHGSPRLQSDGESLYFVGNDTRSPDELVQWQPDAEVSVIHRSGEDTIDDAFIAQGSHETLPTRDGHETHAWVYPPTNPNVVGPTDEAPPLVLFAHGGPTAATNPALDLSIQFFTSRGFAVADVNYRGSTGYGRAYREALYEQWGITDIEDCIDVARALARDGTVDGERVTIRGGSAGGFVVLGALAFHDALAGGASYYGVADLERLAALTHKFESRYLDQLVGPYPEQAQLYAERSPVNDAASIDVPVLLLQGAEDEVVPLEQAEDMADALASNDVPHYLLVFDNEQHGFRQASSRERAHAAELAFYGEVLDIEIADDYSIA